MKLSSLKWLLCATILSAQSALAEEPSKEGLNTKQSAPVTSISPVSSQTAAFTLRDAIVKALAQSPNLKAFRSGVAAAKGEQQQAGAWVNPEVGIQTEGLAGSGNYKGFDSAEINYGVTQQFLIGGKLTARQNIADKGVEIAALDEQAAALNVIRDVAIAYAGVVAAEESVRLATEQKALAEDVLKSVSVRVGAAAAPLIQKSRAEVERSSATIALDKAQRERDITRKNLAVIMGEERFSLPLDTVGFYTIRKPELGQLEEKLKSNPDLIKLDSSFKQSKARFALEKANAIPDPSVNVGVRDYRESGDQAFMIGVSLPIPVFNANRGNITKARNEVTRTELSNRQFALNTNAELTQAHERLQNAYMQAETLKNEILPSAEMAFRLAREGYGVGRFPYLEVLDAQRSLFGVKQQQIDAIREFHTTRAQLERLTASHISDITLETKEGTDHAE